MADFSGAGQAFLTWLKQSGAEINSKIRLEDLRHAQAGRGVGKCPFSNFRRGGQLGVGGSVLRTIRLLFSPMCSDHLQSPYKISQSTSLSSAFPAQQFSASRTRSWPTRFPSRPSKPLAHGFLSFSSCSTSTLTATLPTGQHTFQSCRPSLTPSCIGPRTS